MDTTISADTLAAAVYELAARYEGLARDPSPQAGERKPEASYLYGSAAVFDVVAAELRDARPTQPAAVEKLAARYAALAEERTQQARTRKAEASYFFGAAAAFDVVAAELRQATVEALSSTTPTSLDGA